MKNKKWEIVARIFLYIMLCWAGWVDIIGHKYFNLVIIIFTIIWNSYYLLKLIKNNIVNKNGK